ncbi:receptor like protein 6 [Hibiscus trionum]|uniref:Receptor like protein 6 n=1 Tax=Hibiscus trionum TaxID=183268 RepID=A0A9W7MM56_HIBTR|nr:receptor like protein 6 [Hibiscus trionum]
MKALIPSCLVLFSLLFAYNSSAQTPSSSCPRDQSFALIQFSNSFSVQCSDISPCSILKAKTASWKKGTDCCLWDGVKCDTETGNVIGLHLSCSCLKQHPLPPPPPPSARPFQQ